MVKRAYTKKQKAAAQPGARIKGGTKFDPEQGAWIAILHIWPNVLAEGEPKEYTDGRTFPTELMALGHYHEKVRPVLNKIREELSKLDSVEEMKNLMDKHLN